MPRHTLRHGKIVRLAVEEASDAELVKRHLQVDAAALESIVRRHGPTALGLP